MPEDEHARLARIRPNLQKRAQIFRFTRDFFTERGFLDVETPVRVPAVAPEIHIEPFESEGWFLSTSPELHMKRLLAAGYERLFQISRCFRKGERGKLHNPEFAMLEWYRARAGYREILRDTEDLLFALAKRFSAAASIVYQGQAVDLTPPWPVITVSEAFRHSAGWDPIGADDLERFDIDLVNLVVPAFPLHRPTILLDYPREMASLARLNPENNRIAERAEVFIAGLELANAYSELTDPKEQRKRFEADIAMINCQPDRRAFMPPRFIEALDFLPPCGGIALGMDRLVMLFCDAASIDEVTAFTTDIA